MNTTPNVRIVSEPHGEGDDRRGFFAKFMAVVVGGLAVVFPVAAGARVFLDPMRRKSGRGDFIRITTLDALPADGTPREFPVIAIQQDAWTKYPPGPIGSVFLRRLPDTDNKVEALNVICPHLGCPVGYHAASREYRCPCHKSVFAVDGELISGVSPRGLDPLDYEVRDENGTAEVWVRFQNFYTGRRERKAKA